MKVETTDKEYCVKTVEYWADPDVLKEKETEAVEALRKVQIPGFRKGKAPDYAIRARCKQRIRDWMAREMCSQAFDDVIFETNIKPIGYPEFKEIKCNGKEYFCKMDVYVKPQFELGKYEGLKIPKPDINRDVDAMVEASVQDLRMRLGDKAPYGEEDVVDKKDQITMSFEATINGESFEGSSAQGELYTVGEGKFPEFDDFLIGMKPDEEREFELVFPDDIPEIGGKTANFKVTVHMGMKQSPHPIDDSFLEKCGVKDLDELKDKLRTITSARVKENESLYINQQISKQLVASHDFEVPEFLLKPEAQRLAQQYGFNFKDLEEDKQKELLEVAEKNTKLSLILDSIKDEEPEAFMDDSEAQNALMNKLQQQGQDPNKFLVEAQKNGTLASIVSSLKNEFVLQWIASKAEIVE